MDLYGDFVQEINERDVPVDVELSELVLPGTGGYVRHFMT